MKKVFNYKIVPAPQSVKGESNEKILYFTRFSLIIMLSGCSGSNLGQKQ